MMFPKPLKRQKERNLYNSLRTGKKPKKQLSAWKEGLLSHHKRKSELGEEENAVTLALAYKLCKECGVGGLFPARTMNCKSCGAKGTMLNKPEMLAETKERNCECGCGETVYSPTRFVSGHNGKLKSKPGTYRRDGRAYTMTACSVCSQKIERRVDNLAGNNYCSPECQTIGQKNYYEEHPEKKVAAIEKLKTGMIRNCKQCQSEFYVSQSYFKKGGGKFCSRKCCTKWQIDHPRKNFIGSADNSGEKNGRYKHGKRIGGHISKPKVRKAVIERDKGNWCSICGVPGPGLHLHRVIYGSQGGKYEVDNCILLCAEHHDIVHSNKRVWQPLLLDYLKANDVNKPLIGGKPIRDLGYGFFDD